MKGIRLIFLLSFALLAACDDDQLPDPPVPNPPPAVPPTIAIISPAQDVTIDSGNTMSIVYKTDTGSSELKELLVLENGQMYTDTNMPFSNPLSIGGSGRFGETDSIEVKPHGITGSSSKFALILKDVTGLTDTVHLKVRLEKLYAQEFTQGVLDNPRKTTGLVTPGYNLISNLRRFKTSSPSELDMINTSDVSSTAPEFFVAGWESKTDTRFVVAPGYDYDNASVGSTLSAYLSGTPSAKVSGLQNGDIVIASLRNTGEFAVIKVTSINLTVGDNLDKILFHYKKL